MTKTGEFNKVTLAGPHIYRVKFERERKSVSGLRITDEELHFVVLNYLSNS